MGFRNLLLPVMLVILASVFLLDRGPFGGRFFVWGLAVLTGGSIVFNSFCRELRSVVLFSARCPADCLMLHIRAHAGCGT